MLFRSDGKILAIWRTFDYPAFWEQIWFNEKIKDRDLPEPVKLHQPHLISGTVALADITEQIRVYHYTFILLIWPLLGSNFFVGFLENLRHQKVILKSTNLYVNLHLTNLFRWFIIYVVVLIQVLMGIAFRKLSHDLCIGIWI